MSADKLETRGLGGSMNDWADAAQRAGLSNLASEIIEGETVKTSGMEMLEQLNLPRIRRLRLPLADFLSNPKKVFGDLKFPKYHISLLSDIEGKRRLRDFPLGKKQVLSFVHRNVLAKERGEFSLVLTEALVNLYAGNIVVDENGGILLEAAPGYHIDLVTGKKTPTIFGIRDQFLGTTKISSGDPKLEKVFLEAINCIPKDNVQKNGKIDPHPGYYEFVVVKKGKLGLSPIFTDYRGKELYQTTGKTKLQNHPGD